VPELANDKQNHPWVKRLNFWIFVVVVALVSISGYYRRSYLDSMRPPADGLKPAPDFTLKRSNGDSIRVSDWKDHMVVVHFWASWCAPCIPEIPEILSAAKRLPKDNNGRAIYWLLVSQDQTWEKAHSVLKEETLPENVISVLDPEAKVSDQFGSYQFPETYLITRDRGLGAKWIGAQEWTGKWGENVISGIESASRFGTLPKGTAGGQ